MQLENASVMTHFANRVTLMEIVLGATKTIEILMENAIIKVPTMMKTLLMR